MNQKFERVARHLYQRKYRGPAGDWTTLYYARFVCRLKGRHRIIPLGSDEVEAKGKLKKLEAKDFDGYDFDLDRQRMTEPEKQRDGKQRHSRSLNGRKNIRHSMTSDERDRSAPTFY